ncbi:DUF126 domain-containing protein [Methanoplanus endosymbiosus]|uniref:Phosphomevalonate dehydratase small subunit n=1 Tax=Methanoplanus endosymbiosus TaxID=33865 RepID=A0A9E7TJL3_9EURY|nr:DUF126 domain-containing protein [Methanoplanus endosymbiosus]UUX91845.1 DUF126 domain-containing protein [Methanoplanus endosymbiosus]
MSFTIQCRGISKGKAKGEIIVSKDPISFLSGVDPETGVVMEKGHAIEGRSIAGKVLIFPYGKGSTVGSYIVYALKKNGKAPAAIINNEAETIIATGAIIADIPMVDRPSQDISVLKDGMTAEVDGDKGIIFIEE